MSLPQNERSIVWLFPKFLWDRKLSPVRRDSLLAIGRHPSISLHITGPGWEDYNSSLSITENINRLGVGVDLIGWYKPLGDNTNPEYPSEPLRGISELCIPTCMRFNEAWWPDRLAVREVQESRTQLVICHHAEDLIEFSKQNDETYPLQTVHIPHGACQNRYYTPVSSSDDRSIPLLLTGSLKSHLDEDLYPLRKRVAQLILDKRLPGTIRKKPPDVMPNSAAIERELLDYSAQLKSSKIVIMDGTRHQYPLAKYSEAAMAGAFVLGTAPRIAPPHFGDLFEPIDPRSKDEHLCSTIELWLKNSEERIARSQLAQQTAIEHFSQVAYAEAFYRVITAFLDFKTRC